MQSNSNNTCYPKGDPIIRGVHTHEANPTKISVIKMKNNCLTRVVEEADSYERIYINEIGW